MKNKAELPEFDRKAVFDEVDASNQRFESYTKEQRLEFRELARKNAIKIWNIIPNEE